MRDDTKLYTIRLVLATLVGALSAWLSAGEYHWVLNVLTAAAIYVASVYALPRTLRIKLDKSTSRMVATTGLAAYVFVWLVSWFLLFNVLT